MAGNSASLVIDRKSYQMSCWLIGISVVGAGCWLTTGLLALWSPGWTSTWAGWTWWEGFVLILLFVQYLRYRYGEYLLLFNDKRLQQTIRALGHWRRTQRRFAFRKLCTWYLETRTPFTVPRREQEAITAALQVAPGAPMRAALLPEFEWAVVVLQRTTAPLRPTAAAMEMLITWASAIVALDQLRAIAIPRLQSLLTAQQPPAQVTAAYLLMQLGELHGAAVLASVPNLTEWLDDTYVYRLYHQVDQLLTTSGNTCTTADLRALASFPDPLVLDDEAPNCGLVPLSFATVRTLAQQLLERRQQLGDGR